MQQDNGGSQLSVGAQIKAFVGEIGAFTKIMFTICTLVYLIFNLIVVQVRKLKEPEFTSVALCPAAVMDAGQVYRFFTAEVVHGSAAHILSNMVMFLIWGTSLEKHYGTAFYASINLALCILSNLLTVAVNFLVAYTFPI